MNSLLLPLLAAVLVLTACGSSGDSNDPLTLRLVETTRTLSSGSIDVITTDYSESGDISRQVGTRNGEVFLTTTFETNADGQFIRRSEDTDQDGLEDQSSTYEYTSGLGLSRIYRIGSNTLINEVDIFRFEGAIAISRETREIDDVATPDLVLDSSGVLTIQRNFDYENGRISANNIDSDGDGDIDRQESYSYNPDGTLSTTTLSSSTDGVISSSTYAYEPGVCNNNFGNSASSYFCVATE